MSTRHLTIATLLYALLSDHVFADPLASITPSYAWGRGITVPALKLTLGGYCNAQADSPSSQATLEDLSLFVTWSPLARIRFFSELELEDWLSTQGAARFSNAYRVERLYADMLVSDSLTLRLGKFLTPVGRWNVTHAAPLVWTTTRPVLTEKTLTPEHLTGGLLSQTFELAGRSVDILLYGDDASELDLHREDSETDNALGARINIELSDNLQLGGSYLNFSHGVDDKTARRVDELGVDFYWQGNGYELLFESVYLHTDLRGKDNYGLYLQGVLPLYQQVFAVARYEYLSPVGVIKQNTHIGVMGLTWRPYTPLAIKVEYRLGQHNQAFAPDGLFGSIAVFF